VDGWTEVLTNEPNYSANERIFVRNDFMGRHSAGHTASTIALVSQPLNPVLSESWGCV
jgi:hypothetical protein